MFKDNTALSTLGISVAAVNSGQLEEHSGFERQSGTIASCALFVTKEEETLMLCSGTQIELCNLEGNIKKRLPFSVETEGYPHWVDVSSPASGVLVSCTTKQRLRLWNVLRASPKPIGSARSFEDKNGRPLGSVKQLRVNSNGTRVALLADKPENINFATESMEIEQPRAAELVRERGKTQKNQTGSTIYVYDVEFDNFLEFDCGASRIPVSFSWDPQDPRMLAVHTAPVLLNNQEGSHSHSNSNNNNPYAVVAADSKDTTASGTKISGETITVYVAENTLYQQDCIANPASQNSIPLVPVSVAVPFLYFLREGVHHHASSNTGALQISPLKQHLLTKVILNAFVALEKVKPSVKKALLDFSYHISSGDTDAAYNAVSKNITSHSVWESLAKVCVKTRRLDVVEKCVGQTGNVNAALGAFQRDNGSLAGRHEGDPTSRLATIASYLGMLEDAERLFKEASRFDLLNKFYQASSAWEKAIETAEKRDRIHLQETYYNYAVYLRGIGNRNGALKHFQLAGSELPECTKLLLEGTGSGNPQKAAEADQRLRDYVGRRIGEAQSAVENSKEAKSLEKLRKWYGQYLESKHDLAGASREYTQSRDWNAAVRVHCFCGEVDTAKKLCEDTKDKASCHYLAGYLEQTVAHAETQMDPETEAATIRESMRFYSLAGCAEHSLRLAQQHNLESDLMSLALGSAKSQDLCSAARYYERLGTSNKEYAAKAVTLYRKAGQTGRAMDLCFTSKLFEPLRQIVQEITTNAKKEGADGKGKLRTMQRRRERMARVSFARTGILVETRQLTVEAFSKYLPSIIPKISSSAEEVQPNPPAEEVQADPQTLSRCASFFMENEQHGMAVELLCITGQHQLAVDLCYEHGVTVTDAIAEKLTPGPEHEGKLSAEEKLIQLKKIGRICKEQGNFQAACKKYTQSGDKVKAMKCLLKSGDTEKISFFAGTARQPEIYVSVLLRSNQRIPTQESVNAGYP